MEPRVDVGGNGVGPEGSGEPDVLGVWPTVVGIPLAWETVSLTPEVDAELPAPMSVHEFAKMNLSI